MYILCYSISIKFKTKITVLEVQIVVNLRKEVTRRECGRRWGDLWVLVMFVCDLSTGCYGNVHFAKIQQAVYLLHIHLYIYI